MLFSEPLKFIKGLPIALDSQKYLLQILFGNRFDVLFEKLEKQLKVHLRSDSLSESEDVRLTFIIGGSLHAMKTLKFEREIDDDILANELSNIIQKLNN